eukprot:1117958-Karenia_brevis.AAC.1
MLVTDWEEFWVRTTALAARVVTTQVKKVKAHATDEAVASKEQQIGRQCVVATALKKDRSAANTTYQVKNDQAPADGHTTCHCR